MRSLGVLCLVCVVTVVTSCASQSTPGAFKQPARFTGASDPASAPAQGAALQSKSPEELIGMLRTQTFIADANEFSQALILNAQIQEELRGRGEAARPALIKHQKDQSKIFTGVNAEHQTVGQFCEGLLQQVRK